MKLKHAVFLCIILSVIIMHPVSKITGITYPALLLTSWVIITIITILGVFKTSS